MNEREQARAELAVMAREFVDRARAEFIVDQWLTHPRIVLRALGMEPWQNSATDRGVWVERVWVEPPTDQDSGAET